MGECSRRGCSPRQTPLPEVLKFAGVVIAGDGRGRAIGFPTGNLQVDQATLEGLPRGVFAGHVRLDDEGERVAVVNIGNRPTFAGDGRITVEVHVLDFDGDLYGKTVAVRLGQRLRDEERFDSVEELTRQIALDIERTRHCGA